jgi:hypothetical protein
MPTIHIKHNRKEKTKPTIHIKRIEKKITKPKRDTVTSTI